MAASADSVQAAGCPELAEFSLTVTPASADEPSTRELIIGCMRSPESFDTGEVGLTARDRVSSTASTGSSVYSAASDVSMALWAYIWSCNVFLCELAVALPLQDVRVHELGAGCALGAVAAAAVGAKAVVASDIVTAAAGAVEHSVQRNKPATPIDYVLFDWSDEAARVRLGGSADLVLGSDVAYMAQSVPALAAAALALLAPGGAAIIVDPCRLGADGLEQALADEASRCGNATSKCYKLHNAWSPNNAAVPELRIFVVLKDCTGKLSEAAAMSELQLAVEAAVEQYMKVRCCGSLDEALQQAGLQSSSHTLDVDTRIVG